jgi:AraC-like DNA-binding protein
VPSPAPIPAGPTKERFETHALGRPYHAALVDLRGRSEPHGHADYFEIMLVLDGDGSQDLGPGLPERVLPLRPGELILIRPRDQHAIAGPVRFYNIAFPVARWRAFADLAGVDPAWHDAALPPRRRLSPGSDDADRARAACALALERFRSGPRQFDLIRFWTDIVPVLGPAPEAVAERPAGAPDWLVTACAAMRREPNLRLGVPRLVELARVSPAHLARTLRRHYDTTATAYVAELRLRHAAMLLTTTMRPVADIAAACGYSSPAYFTRCFRAAHDRSPREFRQLAQHAFVPRPKM